MTTEPRDVAELRDLMRAAGMLPAVPPALTDDVTGREALLSRILAEARAGDEADRAEATAGADEDVDAGTVVSVRSGRLGRTRRRVLTLAVASTAVLVAVLGTQLSSGPQAVAGTPAALTFTGEIPDVVAGTAPSAAASLTVLAETASTAPPAPVGGDVQRVATYAWLHVQDGVTGTISTVPTQSVWWLSADGAVEFSQVRTGAITPDGQIDPAAGPVPAADRSTDTYPAGSLVPATLVDLPREAAGLTAELVALAGGEPCTVDEAHQAACLVTAVQQLFSQYVVPGDLAAAMWSVLAEQPGVYDLGSTTDRFGRPGRAVAVAPATDATQTDAPETVTVLVVSPADGQLLGVEMLAVSGPNGPITPSVTGFTAWNTSSWVAASGS